MTQSDNKLSIEEAADPFIRLYRMNSQFHTDDTPLRDHVPGVWPTWGDLRQLYEALQHPAPCNKVTPDLTTVDRLIVALKALKKISDTDQREEGYAREVADKALEDMAALRNKVTPADEVLVPRSQLDKIENCRLLLNELMERMGGAASLKASIRDVTTILWQIANKRYATPQPEPRRQEAKADDADAEILFALEMACEHDIHHQAQALRTWLPQITEWCEQYILAKSAEPETQRKADGETPRTDALALKLFGNSLGYGKLWDHARTLERELNAALTQPVDPDSEKANPVWDLVISACARAWPLERPDYSECPTELIVRLINERDEARALTQLSPKPSQGEWMNDIRKVLEGFENRTFLRCTENDATPSWSIKILPYLSALARLQNIAAAPSTDSPNESSKDGGK